MPITLTCLECGQANRFPDDRLDSGPKCGTCGAALLSARPVEIALDILDKARRTDTIPLVVDFWAAWCGPCRMMAPEFAKAAGMLKGKARFAKLDTEAFPDAGARFGIRGIPLMIAFRKGREIDRHAGAVPAAAIAQWVGAATARA